MSHPKREELARRILETIANGDPVVFRDAIQLRNWAPSPEDALLTLEEIARKILSSSEENR